MSKYKLSEETIKKVEKIWGRICLLLPEEYKNLQICFTFSNYPNYNTYDGGMATSDIIVIGINYLNQYPSDIAIAEMLAHEVGHHIFGHVHGIEINSLGEQDSDHFAMYICQMLGFSRKEFIRHTKEFELNRQAQVSKKHVDTHGTGMERVNRLIQHDEFLTNLNIGI